MNCAVDHILQEFYTLFLTEIQNLPNCFTTPNKMTSEDDIKGLVSLKFLRPWVYHMHYTKLCKEMQRVGLDWYWFSRIFLYEVFTGIFA